MGEEQENKSGTERDEAIQRPSKDYETTVNAFKEYHETSTNYSGKFLRPHVKYIKSLIDQFDIKSILDYGCGKGLQYEWIIPEPSECNWLGVIYGNEPTGQTIEEYWGIEVTKYDPCVPKFETKPTGKYDLVICTHVLGCIPIKDLRTWAVAEIFGYANKLVYVAEGIERRPGKKAGLIDKTIKMPNLFGPLDWIKLIVPRKPEGITCELLCRYRTDFGTFSGRFRL